MQLERLWPKYSVVEGKIAQTVRSSFDGSSARRQKTRTPHWDEIGCPNALHTKRTDGPDHPI
jgi:hypothetical protein